MRAYSPNRRLSVTKNTHYPSLATERRPSEVAHGALAMQKTIARDFETNRTNLHKIQRKSMTELDNQRKILEKSMLAYTEKMKELMDSKTNNLFRGIQIKVAHNPTKSPSSLPASLNGNIALIPVDSARLRKRRLHMRRQGMLSDRQEVTSTIEEEETTGSGSGKRIRSSSADILRRRGRNVIVNRLDSDKMTVIYNSPTVSDVQTRVESHKDAKYQETVSAGNSYSEEDVIASIKDNGSTVSRLSGDISRQSSFRSRTNSLHSNPRSSRSNSITTPRICVGTDDTRPQNDRLPQLNREPTFFGSAADYSSDSAYNSCTDDEEGWFTDPSDSRSEAEDTKLMGDTSCGQSKMLSVRFVEPNPAEGNLLTVPKVYRRRRNSKSKHSVKINKDDTDGLLRKTILKNAVEKS